MGRGFRFLKWGARSERRTIKLPRKTKGPASQNRRLLCESLEDRRLLTILAGDPPLAQPFPYAQGFESGSLATLPGWNFTATRRLLVGQQRNNNPHGGTYALQASQNGVNERNARCNPGARSVEPNRRDQPGTRFLGQAKLLLRRRHLQLVRQRRRKQLDVRLGNVTAETQYTHYAVDLDQALSNAEISLDSDVYVKFQHTRLLTRAPRSAWTTSG